MDDYRLQLDHVKANAGRLLWLQDRNPLSPAFGCFHYAYWRDKTSDVADARFQEAGAALGLLAHPELHDASLPPREELLAALAASATFLARIQHADGCFDEWYKGERGFAATEFPLVAFGLALHFLGDAVPEGTRRLLLATLRRAGDWLLTRDDHVKTNHEAAACAALAVLHALTGDARYEAGARAKRAVVLRAQTDEGWFNEVAGMDLGYCGVLLDYMMLAHLFLPDAETVPAMKRLYAFLFRFLFPDMTIPAEAGICLNPYVSRLGTVLLSPHSPEAAEAARRFDAASPGFAGLSPYLGDDLRLCRWSYLPLVTVLLRARLEREGTYAAAAGHAPAEWEDYYPRAAVFTRKRKGLHLVFMPAAAGALEARLQGPDGRWRRFTDRGYSLQPPRGPALFTGGYRLDRLCVRIERGLRVEVPFVPAIFFYPPYLARVVLRLGCALPGGSYWLRKGIDAYRQWKGTALNQSAAPVASGDTGLTLTRELALLEDGFELRDEVVARRAGLDLSALRPWVEGDASVEPARRETSAGAVRLSRRVGTPGPAALRTSASPSPAP